jgi:uncharacterized repeat protein (TIGR03847 family)
MVTVFAYEQEDAGEAEPPAQGDEEDDSTPPTFACQVSRAQCRAFAERAEQTITAGRPVCLLCGGPIDNGEHRCGRRNGHSKQRISLQDGD